MYLNGGTYQIDSADDSIHSNANITIADGTYTLATGDDGVHADDALIVNGGTITVTESYEGLEGLTVTINDGTIDITARDDGVNAAGGTDRVVLEHLAITLKAWILRMTSRRDDR